MGHRKIPQDQGRAGQVPYRLWVGVTGHRSIPDEPGLPEQVRSVLLRIGELVPKSKSTQGLLGAISPLAEGSDRLFVREMLSHERTVLESPLPLPVNDYVWDFVDPKSRQEFRELLQQADLVIVLPSARNRSIAYSQVGDYIVERSDVLVALWDGHEARGEGGTADVVAVARSRQMPLYWICTQPEFQVAEELGRGVSREVFHEIDSYNRSRVSTVKIQARSERQAEMWLRAANNSGLPKEHVQPYWEWILPYLTRADLLANRYHALYSLFGSALFMLAALSVAAAAVQVLSPSGLRSSPWSIALPWLEVVALALAVGLIIAARRMQVHGRWISSHSLAERFRVAFFLCVAGLGSERTASIEGVHQAVGPRFWTDRIFEEVWITRPKDVPQPDSLDPVKTFLTEAWIEQQSRYYEKTHRSVRRRSAILSLIVAILLIAAMAAAGVHGAIALTQHESQDLSQLLLFFAVLLPAMGGAAGGIQAQREYESNAIRLEAMARRLRAVGGRIDRASDLTTLKAGAEAIGLSMLAEHRDWYATMYRHAFKVHELV